MLRAVVGCGLLLVVAVVRCGLLLVARCGLLLVAVAERMRAWARRRFAACGFRFG